MNYSLQCAVNGPDGVDKHMTLLYLGPQDEMRMNKLEIASLFLKLSKDINWPIKTRTTHIDNFGEHKDIRALVLYRARDLNLARYISEDFFKLHNIKYPETWDYNPHISTDLLPEKNPIPLEVPVQLFFPHIVKWEFPK